MDELLIVDGNSIANRAFYALPFLSNKDGKPSGAVFGFANILIKLILQENPSHVLVAFDHARKTFRNEIYSEYKMQRKPAPEELLVQFPVIKQMLETMGIKVIEKAGIEADDIIGTASKMCKGKKIILSGDRDLLQLIDDDTTVWLTKKGVSELDKVDQPRLLELFGLEPYQIVELKALMGDASDNIPGVKGIGEKTALSLLEKYSNIDNLYSHIDEIQGKLKEKLIADKDMAFISKTLATISRDEQIDFNLDECKLQFPFSRKVYEFFEEWSFSSLLKNNNLFSEKENIIKKTIKKYPLTKEILQNIDNKNLVNFCYNLNNFEFLINNNIYFVEKNYSLFDGISIDEIFAYLKDIFEDEKIEKITLNAKSDMKILSKYGIELNNFYDLIVAEYVLESGNKKLNDNIELSDYATKKLEFDKLLKENKLEFVYQSIEKPLIKILFQMEQNGFKLDKSKLINLSNEFDEKINKLKNEIYFEAGEEFNISSPKQVGYILFDKLGIKSYNNKKKSTRANVLDELRFIPIVNKILTYRKYNKLKNTYIDVYLKLIYEGGDVIHTTFNQTLTSTGRLSSSEPNLQNIPTRDDEGKALRKIFISKFEGGQIISADYNQIELRLLADMSGEEKLIQSYKEGQDIHRITASQIFGVDENEVTEAQRRDAKAVNFGIIYGISDYGLSQNIKSSREIAKNYISSYFSRYPLVEKFMQDNVEFAREHGFALTKFGRRRNIPEINSSKYLTRTFGERVAMNMPLQGTASDIIKLAMIRTYNSFEREHLKSQLILQIHDELIVDVYPGEENQVKSILQHEMENVTTLKVPLVVSMGAGQSLYECK